MRDPYDASRRKAREADDKRAEYELEKELAEVWEVDEDEGGEE